MRKPFDPITKTYPDNIYKSLIAEANSAIAQDKEEYEKLLKVPGAVLGIGMAAVAKQHDAMKDQLQKAEVVLREVFDSWACNPPDCDVPLEIETVRQYFKDKGE